MADLIAAYVNTQQLDAIYQEFSDVNIDIDEYPMRGTIIVPKGDAARVRFSVYDEDGDAFDLSTAVDVEFAVSIDQSSPIFLSKKLSTGGITVSGNTFTVTITSANSKLPMHVRNYFEAAVQLTSTQRRTVAAGVYRAPDTILGL